MSKKDATFQILIVDDNKELRSIIEEYLGDNGDFIEGAGDGKEALEKYTKNPYDLIITDLNMPELTGIDLIKCIRKENAITEFIIITGYASLDTAVEAVKIGAFDYIVKPFRMEELKVVVKNVKDKILLKKTNMELFKKLKSFYDEIERYRQNDKLESNGDNNLEKHSGTNSETRETSCEPNLEMNQYGNDTERLVVEIKHLEKLVKGRLMIE